MNFSQAFQKIPSLTFQEGKVCSLDSVAISSARLLLVPITSFYTEVIYKEFTDQITRYMFPAPPRSVADTEEFIKSSTEKRMYGNDLTTVILSKESQEFLGCAGIHGGSNPKQPSFGIWLKESAHGHRYGKEAIHALYGWGEENLIVDYYTYPVDRANIPSRKIPESLQGIVIEEKFAPTQRNTMLDEVVYRIDRGKKSLV